MAADVVPFDMYGVRFTHQDGGCTFETLVRTFGITDPAVARIGGLVHALDLDDGAAPPADSATMQVLIDGLQLSHADDDTLLAQGIALFDALYRAYSRQALPSAARRRQAHKPPRTSSRRSRLKRANH